MKGEGPFQPWNLPNQEVFLQGNNLLQAKTPSHGDYNLLLFGAGTLAECYTETVAELLI